MGVRIAAHLANAGIPVVLLDLAGDTGKRHRRRRARGSQPRQAGRLLRPSQYPADPTRNLRPRPGASFQMRLGDRSRHREPGHQAARLLAKITPFLKPGVILTTNTSGLPVATHCRAAARPSSAAAGSAPTFSIRRATCGCSRSSPPRRPIRRPLPPLPILPTVAWARSGLRPRHAQLHRQPHRRLHHDPGHAS